MEAFIKKHIGAGSGILGGKPCIKGTRISVQMILEWFSSGTTEKEILENYPHLSAEGIRAALAFAALSMYRDVYIDLKVS